MGGISGGAGGGMSSSSSAASRSGDAGGSSGTGSKVFNFGANPNTGLAGSVLTNPLVLGAGMVVLFLVLKRRR